MLASVVSKRDRFGTLALCGTLGSDRGVPDAIATAESDAYSIYCKIDATQVSQQQCKGRTVGKTNNS